MTPREKFDALRAKYVKARDALGAINVALHVKYGRGGSDGKDVPDSWLKTTELIKRGKARAKVDEAGDAFYAHLQAISPRDWGSGAPVRWLYEDLTWEDAVRPVGEKLSVVPPLAYGCTQPIV